MVTTAAAAQGAIIGVCLGVGICVIMMILFLLMYTRTKIEDDTNIRRRVITYDAFDQTPPAKAEYIPIQEPPAPPPAPVPAPPPPPAQALPRTYIEEQPIRVRSNSWSGAPDDEWVLVKTITKHRNNGGVKIREINDNDDNQSSSSSSDDEEEETKKVKRSKRSMMTMNTMMPRLAPYDLAVPMPMFQARPRMMGGAMMGGPMMGGAMGGAYMMPQPQMAATMPIYGAPTAMMAAPTAMMAAPTAMMAAPVSTFQPGYMPYYA